MITALSKFELLAMLVTASVMESRKILAMEKPSYMFGFNPKVQSKFHSKNLVTMLIKIFMVESIIISALEGTCLDIFI